MSALRFPSDPVRLAELWDVQDKPSARWDFVATAIARGNLPALRVACANPFPVGEFGRKSYLTLCDLVAKREGQFGLIVHQRHQLAGDVDVATGDREGILHRGIQDGETVGARVYA